MLRALSGWGVTRFLLARERGSCVHNAPRSSLTSPSFRRQDSRDIKITDFSISLFGKMLFEDQTIELTYGHRYVRSSTRPAP